MHNSTAAKSTGILRPVCIILCELFTVAAIVYLLIQKAAFTKLLLAFVTLILVLLPAAAERLLHCKFWTPLYLYTLIYALGPMLGHSLHFYYWIPWWDKFLHISGGIIFAIVGIILCSLLLKKDQSKRVLIALFALCFSMAISVVWEFYEFGSDRLFGMDMQNDSIVTQIHSFTLDDSMGDLGSISDIQSVVINGEVMPWNGYLDIGLIDTMWDMLLETLGALAVVIFYLVDRGKHPWLQDTDHGSKP